MKKVSNVKVKLPDKNDKSTKVPRVVPAFSYQSIQKNTVVEKPPKTEALKLISSKPKSNLKNNFHAAYDRNDLPLRIDHSGTYPKIQWTVPFDKIDYDKWLPIFMDGLMDPTFPCNLLSEKGCYELIENGGDRVLSALPFCIISLKDVLHSRQPNLMIIGMKVLQKLATDVPFGGEALLPYYRQLLPPLGRFKDKNVNIGDKVEFGQRKQTNLGDMIELTLQILEQNGGEHAFINMRYIIPTYESCTGKTI